MGTKASVIGWRVSAILIRSPRPPISISARREFPAAMSTVAFSSCPDPRSTTPLAFNRSVLFSFATAADWSGTFTALLVLLLVFVIRDAYIHGREPYRTDGITDAAMALVFLLAHEALTLQWAPSLAAPRDVFFKGAVACLPLLTIFRMLSRPLPQPDPDTPLCPGMPPERIYWRMVRR